MLHATDSFLQYLATELTGIPVHWRRHNPSDENAGMLKQGHLNVQFFGYYGRGSTEDCLVSLDLLGSDERMVLGQLQQVTGLLRSEQFVPVLDYTNPSLPVATGQSVSWEGGFIRFLKVRTPEGASFVHFNATFPLLAARE